MNQPQNIVSLKPAQIRPWLLIIFLVVLLAGGGYLGYYYWNKSKTATPTATTVSTSDLKTYTNNDLGFSIKYPKDLTKSIEKGANPSEPDRLLWIDFTNTDQYGTSAIAIETQKNVYTDIADWANRMNESEQAALYTVRDVAVSGVTGKELSTVDSGGAIRTGFIKDNNLYILHLIGTVASWTDHKNTTVFTEVYNQILSTFQFTP